MEAILKMNEIPTIGGVIPQGDNITVVGHVNGWTVVDVADSAISAIQEFGAQPVEQGFADAINGPSMVGARNARMLQVNGFGDKMKIELNPQNAPDGTPILPPDHLDDRTPASYTEDDVQPYKNAIAWLAKFDNKSVLRNQIRGNIVDIEDDIADTKILSQLAMYYFAHEWQTRTQAQKDANPAKDNMEVLSSKLLSDEVKMRADLKDGIESVVDILEKEERINAFISNNYGYNDGRGS